MKVKRDTPPPPPPSRPYLDVTFQFIFGLVPSSFAKYAATCVTGKLTGRISNFGVCYLQTLLGFRDLKAGVNMKAVVWLSIIFLTQIPRSRFNQSKISLLIPHIYVLNSFVNCFGDFGYIWR